MEKRTIYCDHYGKEMEWKVAYTDVEYTGVEDMYELFVVREKTKGYLGKKGDWVSTLDKAMFWANAQDLRDSLMAKEKIKGVAEVVWLRVEEIKAVPYAWV